MRVRSVWRGRGGRGFAHAGVLLVVVCGVLSGCGLFQTNVQISGSVYGEDITAKKAGKTQYVPLHAMVTCNGTSTETAGDGTYSLSFDASNSFSCTIAASPKYTARTVSLKRGTLQAFHLDFRSAEKSPCGVGAPRADVSCAPLALQPGTLRGTVVSADKGTPKSGVNVQCWSMNDQPASAGLAAPNPSPSLTATTNDDGLFVFRSVAAGPYGCVTEQGRELQRTSVGPAATTMANLQVCEAHCPSFGYSNGPVMHTYTAYVIFWLPPGKHYEPQGSDTRFEQLVQGYFQDISGSDFYNVVTQYWDFTHGPMQNSVTLGGTYLDTQPYPHKGTESDPLRDDDVREAITRAMQATGWTASPNVGFFVITGFGINECGSSDACTFSRNGEAFCAYHSRVGARETPTIYSYIPVVRGCDFLPTYSRHPSPHGDRLADAVLSSISHEHFESATDPFGDGWYASHSHDGEMADLCVDQFGTVAADGGNVTLGNGHRYILQSEWSLTDRACVLGLT